MTTEEIIRTLIEDKQYDKVQTERLAPKIDALPEDIRSALENWIETGSTESPKYSGLGVDEILTLKPTLTTLGAYLTLDWLRRDPRSAADALRRPIIRRV